MQNRLPDDYDELDTVFETPGLLPRTEEGVSLTNAQFDALDAGVAKGRSLIVSSPTSTGKTLIGWWAIASTIAAGGRAVYLVSHRTLAKQKFEEAQRLFLHSHLGGDQTSIVCATGDGVEDASGRKTSSPMSASILIATYEKFLGCLSTGGPPRDLTGTGFVCDEIQLIGDKNRGQKVELLLTLLHRSGWRQFVGLSAVLSQNDSQSLADWLGLRLVRNPLREKSLTIECRTPANILEVSSSPGVDGYITEKTATEIPRDTKSIVSDLLANKAHKPVIVFCMKVDDTYELAKAMAFNRPRDKALEIPSGLEIADELQALLSAGVAYHNAELSEEERIFVEQRLEAGSIDVVFATSTLAAGVNFPLGSAVFSSWKRWNGDKRQHLPIGRAEFQNMAGRVGRMGQIGKAGRVVLSADGVAAVNEARVLMDMQSQDELGRGITTEDFGPLTLQLFSGKLCSDRQQAFDLLASTLSAAREAERGHGNVDHWRVGLNEQIDRLVSVGCLLETSGGITVTAFGAAVARSGLKPETALYFIDGLLRNSTSLMTMLPSSDSAGSEDSLAFTLTHAAFASPEFGYSGGNPTRFVNWRLSKQLVSNAFAVRLEDVLFDQPWMGNVRAANSALVVTKWATGQARKSVEQVVPSVRIGTVEGLARDAAWILAGISEVLSSITSPTLADEGKPEALRGNSEPVRNVRKMARVFRRLGASISAGLPSALLWMTFLDLQGRPRRLSRAQILSLRDQGLARPVALMDGLSEADHARRVALGAMTNPQLANRVRDAAKNWKIQDREHCRKGHLRRAASVDGVGVIDALYLSKGDAFESAFQAAVSFVAIQCERLDARNKQAYPDFLMTIENFPPIVFEIKSKMSETALVSLNDASEVLTASELIGMKENFCVTLCNPGVEPSVPSTIESCGRLCVVEVADFAEAVLRIREGGLTREEFYNWLTTPGIAVSEDLPPPR